MSKLPVAEHLFYNVSIPGTLKSIKYRPMVVKEHRLMMEALQFENADAIVNVIKSIAEACTNNSVDVDKLTMAEMDFLFLQIRAKSAGEIMQVQYKCNNIVTKTEDDKTVQDKCGRIVTMNINLMDANIVYPEGFKKSIVIPASPTSGMKLTEPTFEAFRRSLKNETNEIAVSDQFIFSCVESVYDKDKIFIPGKDFSYEDFKEFIDDLEPKVLGQIDEFFNNMPGVQLSFKFKCPQCGHQDIITIEGLDSFFD